MKLVRYLCKIFHCPPHVLSRVLAKATNVDYLMQQLKKGSVTLRTNHLSVNREIELHGLSIFGADVQFAYNGFQQTTVEQHMYARHKLTLRYPKLQCLMERGGKKHVYYWPIECVDIEFDQW